jgi:glycosyltransferase involved in cell wall biosynthesis
VRILFVVHNHPDLQPGGSEIFARALFRTLRAREGVEGLFLAGVIDELRERKPGTLLQAAHADEPEEMLVSLDRFDRFYFSQQDIYGLATLIPLVRDLRPDIIHLHHLLLFGTEGLDMLRRAAPQARIVMTLHDYFLICPREGQLLTAADRLCDGPSPTRCRGCFGGRPAADFALRDIGLRDALRMVDQLVAPSAFLRDRFVAAGWPAERFVVLPNAVPAADPAPPRDSADGRRDRFAVFGNVNRFKGTLVALRASARLSEAGVAHRLAVHGGTAWQTDAFLAEFQAALAAAPDATHQGGYAAADLPGLIAAADWVVVPSIWFENAPLVILEAFRHRRPVICGGIGGMAELVADGVNGLHAPPGDPDGLASVMARAAGNPALWAAMVEGIRPPEDLDACASRHLDLYRRLPQRG